MPQRIDAGGRHTDKQLDAEQRLKGAKSRFQIRKKTNRANKMEIGNVRARV